MLKSFGDCIETFYDVKSRLESIEGELAIELNMPADQVRDHLLKQGEQLVETDLVQDWLAAYSAFVGWSDEKRL